MSDILVGGLDVVGDDDDEIVLGARARRMSRGRSMTRVPAPGWMKNVQAQGVSTPQEELDYLPFVPAVIAIGALTGVLVASPQRPFRGERLVMDAIANAVSAVANVVIDPSISIGMVQVGSAQGSAPIATFAAQAFGVRLSMPATGQGTEIRIPVRLLAASAFVTTVTATILGRAVR